jgi:xanthine dehydrogenase YagR molybdenum-binding subunit
MLTGKPWSSNHLLECYAIGAEKFGWAQRSPSPRSMRRHKKLVGWGMSAGIYKAERAPANAGITLYADGHFMIRCSVADTGPGSVTVLTQIAADALSVPMERVRIEWADADLPPAPPQYGSHTTASAGSAVHDAAIGLRDKLCAETGLRDLPGAEDYGTALHRLGLAELSFTSESKPNPEAEKYSGKSFVAHFVEAEVDELTCEVRIKRVVSCLDTGKVINPKTARNQVLGAVTWGIGIALMEEGIIDHRSGRYVNNNLADYHLPVNADIPETEIYFIDKPDSMINPMGAKGIGEIGLVGLTAGIANAVYHATGKRIRDLPITPDKLIP